MKIEDVTPGLAKELLDNYIETLKPLEVNQLSPEQNNIWNGLHALEYIDWHRSSLDKALLEDPSSISIPILKNLIKNQEEMLLQAKEDLTKYLENIDF